MSPAELRERLEEKWAVTDYAKITEKATYAGAILTGWNYNLWRCPVPISPDKLIRVDGELMVERAALEAAAIREMPAFKEKHKINKYRNLNIEPYTHRRYQYLDVKYSESRNKSYEDRLPPVRRANEYGWQQIDSAIRNGNRS